LTPRKDSIAARKRWNCKVARNPTAPVAKDSSAELVQEPAREENSADFCITEQTEVKLDGRPCKFSDVPHDAVIIFLEAVSEKDKTILRIHFRSKQ
ncbi:MAG TPA: hypothetical protein VKU02_00285, partial [Gemmataceae bacterium]|nr:hypothetical protein [Gemmataceae bacterium]